MKVIPFPKKNNKSTEQKIREAMEKFGHLTGMKDRICEHCGHKQRKKTKAFICDKCGL